jgi:hypothetical protein
MESKMAIFRPISNSKKLYKKVWAAPIVITPNPEPEPNIVFDVSVNSIGALNSAITATPNNLNRDYVIFLEPGTYNSHLSLSNNFNRGTTNLVVRGNRRLGNTTLTGITAYGARNVEFSHMNLIGTEFDEFGFPAGSTATNRGLRVANTVNVKAHGLLIENMTFGVEATSSQSLELSYCTIRGFAVDGVRLYSTTNSYVSSPWVHHCKISVNGIYNIFPELSSRGLHYSLPANCAIDPRRSDQYGYGNANSYVENLAGDMVLVTGGFDGSTKSGRHPDCIQFAGPSSNALVEDCELESNNIYCHGIYMQNNDIPVDVSGLIFRRNKITTAHPHGIAFQGRFLNPRVEDIMIRPWPTRTWAVNIPGYASDSGLMRPGISTRETSTTTIVRNVVLPSQIPTYWTQIAKMDAINLIQNDTAEPIGWSSTDVALGRIGFEYAQ